MLGFQRLCLAVVLVVVGLGATASPTYAVDTVTVSGVVLGHDGQPVQGATIEVVPDPDTDDCPEADHSQSPAVLATTDAAGRYSFTCTAGFPWVTAILPSGEFAGWRTFQPGVYDDVVFRAYATRGSISGTVYDGHGAPAAGAEMMFVWDVPGAGAYDYFTADDAGRYRIDRLYPGVRYTVYVNVGDWGEEYVFTATEGDLTHDFVAPPAPPVDEVPGGAITGVSGDRRLKVSGWAYDDTAVAKVKVAIRNRATGRWLRLNGSWGRYQRHVVRMTKPGEPRTGWWLTRRLPPGSYGISLVVVDDSGNRNVGPRPWRSIRVRR
ncbi:carboxypeptidase-like regulatory domain-containing protein [Nocardioides bizhenqiangii]|uniref:Carboxypeptidase regulatory-like domain-containing protein n=1 Tax=Nocardioides bizhenqiangii TaxID=3095076 RepID=A0ABZ0ZLT1_9ACTN|nr:hypothetical protein [Nocardioides sp. HM61]WQQ24679.1 hypothetical protein SHK19_11935 [Nocardioides sp. HM61]